jgi:NAD(P)-dependent dehydrogenase (short-subunit alcohol dehydrogenase family)
VSSSVDRAIAQTTDRFGRLDTLLNVAGTINPEPSASISDESWSNLLGVHLDGTYRCCRAAYPALKASPAAAIVSISSVAATVGIPKRLSYSAAKSRT